MPLHLRRDIDNLKKHILAMGTMVEKGVRRSLQALRDRDRDLADQVIDSDAEVDQREVEIEEECLKIFALHQPVAGDLRFIAAVLKINTDLERMADLAVNIAELAAFLATKPPVSFPAELEPMTEASMRMVHESLNAFVNLDAAKAREVLAQDDQVDQFNRDIIADILESMQRESDTIDQLIRLFSVTRHLERIADHATNIAEDVVYMVEGEIIRHQADRM